MGHVLESDQRELGRTGPFMPTQMRCKGNSKTAPT